MELNKIRLVARPLQFSRIVFINDREGEDFSALLPILRKEDISYSYRCCSTAAQLNLFCIISLGFVAAACFLAAPTSFNATFPP
jgi:hypothetical protein